MPEMLNWLQLKSRRQLPWVHLQMCLFQLSVLFETVFGLMLIVLSTHTYATSPFLCPQNCNTKLHSTGIILLFFWPLATASVYAFNYAYLQFENEMLRLKRVILSKNSNSVQGTLTAGTVDAVVLLPSSGADVVLLFVVLDPFGSSKSCSQEERFALQRYLTELNESCVHLHLNCVWQDSNP